jgi:hypothetical protein
MGWQTTVVDVTKDAQPICVNARGYGQRLALVRNIGLALVWLGDQTVTAGGGWLLRPTDDPFTYQLPDALYVVGRGAAGELVAITEQLGA